MPVIHAVGKQRKEYDYTNHDLEALVNDLQQDMHARHRLPSMSKYWFKVWLLAHL